VRPIAVAMLALPLLMLATVAAQAPPDPEHPRELEPITVMALGPVAIEIPMVRLVADLEAQVVHLERQPAPSQGTIEHLALTRAMLTHLRSSHLPAPQPDPPSRE